MAGPNKLYFIWKFVRKVVPDSFVDSWLQATSYVKRNKHFVVTQLHRNLNRDGAYKYVNFASFDGLSFEGFQRVKPSEEWMKLVKDTHPAAMEPIPGGCTEIGTNTGKPLAPWLPKSENSIFIVTAFKTIDEKDTSLQEAFEKDWMESSGANFILKNAPKDLGISHCGLYKKFTPLPGLQYVLRTELTGVGQSSEAAKAFLSELKGFRYPDYFESTDAELYWPDPQYIIFPESKKDLLEGFTYDP